MESNLFLILTGSLVLMLSTELFAGWYRGYLHRRQIPEHIQRSLMQLKWVLLSILFWNAIYRRFMPLELNLSHLLFTLFIFSLRGLTVSVFSRR